MRSEKGTYILLLKNERSFSIKVGKLGAVALEPGYYLYVGSALGAGGVKARVGRHIKKQKRQHWHIDYIRSKLALETVWVRYSDARKEHDWAGMLSASSLFSAIENFGCSDCDCQSHLFRTKSKPDIRSVPGLSAEKLEVYSVGDVSG